MDRIKVERAIAGLTEWQEHVQTDSDIDRDISTAIEALKAQLSKENTTSDLISRTATIDAVNNAFDRETLLTGFVRSIAVRAIRDMPSVQPEPHEGHWIPVHPIQSDDPGAYMCSKCKTGMWEIRPSAYHFCPNCGARMKGEI